MNFVEAGFVHNGYFIRDSDTAGNFRFDGLAKKIFVNTGVVSITIDDMYSRWIDWSTREDNLKWSAAIRFSGKDVIPGGFTGTTFFTINGWKLVYDANTTAASGVLYSEDYATAYWSVDNNPIYPATVSSLVNAAVVTQNVVTGTALTAEQTANAVWSKALEGLTAEQMMRIMLSAMAGKREGLGTATETYLAQDGLTPRITLTPDVNGNGAPLLNGAA
jgi:hypothetical protein